MKSVKKHVRYYWGIDAGTNSMGHAATDTNYNLLKINGEPAWGVTVFDEASSCSERATFRTSRRRRRRAKFRVKLLQDLFAPEIAKLDENFFKRLQGSYLYRDEAGEPYTLFCDADFTDVEYHHQYPTIHHLIVDLMESPEPHDVRLVYLACAWLVKHRGHFLSNVSKENVSQIRDFDSVFCKLNTFFVSNGYQIPWSTENAKEISEVLKKNDIVKAKFKNLVDAMLQGKKPSKEPLEEFPYSLEAIIRLLAGGTCKLKDLFAKEDYEDAGSIRLGMSEDSYSEVMSTIGEDYELIELLKAIYDWSILSDILGNEYSISAAKKAVYHQHETDVAFLKHILHEYSQENYDKMFRTAGKEGNYVSYAYHTDENDTKKFEKCKSEEDFCKNVLKAVESIQPNEEDKAQFEDMLKRLELHTFMPKQKDANNRVIPYQLYWYELDRILINAEKYLPFLSVTDEDNLSISDKIRSIFLFRVPYFVGPLNSSSSYAWLERKAGKIYPWNFEQMVDLDWSEEKFIRRMTNTCTYLPGETVLPKDSLCYHKFMVLNEINNITINGLRIPVNLKQRIYEDLFMQKKKITRKKLVDYLISNGVIEAGQDDLISGIDKDIHSDLTPQIAFRRLLKEEILSEKDVEKIIERSSYAEDKQRLDNWLIKNYPILSEEDRKYICGIKLKEFGRLSKRFLCGIEGVDTETGEVHTILSALWHTQYNLMELLSSRFTFKQAIDDYVEEYYIENPRTLEQRLDEMHVSNAARRPIYRTLALLKDVTKALGAPEKIFIEMTRGAATQKDKAGRTTSRKQQILKLYEECDDKDVNLLRQQLEAMGDTANNRLQRDQLFLYYMQFGKCMYSGEPIDLSQLGTKLYDIEHIYPQSVVKDDSILNNKVLVRTELNGDKNNTYPISSSIRQKMTPFWHALKEKGMITEEKFKRLTRSTPFTVDERWGFINRQLVETSQSTKALATILKEKYPQTEIVYAKAKLASEFRQEFGLPKSRTYNDLHHAVDAYLNIVVGNVYDMRFTKQWFNINSDYSVKCKTIFTHPVVCGDVVVWDGLPMLEKVKNTAVRSNAHFTKYAFLKTGGLFDQQPVSKDKNLVPRKTGLDTEKYGGYNKSSVMFFIPVHYKTEKDEDTIILSVELMHGKHFLSDETFAKEYAIRRIYYSIEKTVTEISFPMGLKPWKINTVLSLDGFRMCITAISSKGKRLSLQSAMQFTAGSYWNGYVKKLENLVEKVSKNPSYIYTEKYDKVNRKENEQLYDLYIDKLKNSIYCKRWAVRVPLDILISGKSTFDQLSEIKQAEALLNIHSIFGRNTMGSDLSALGGKKNSGATNSFSSLVSNWRKSYSDIRLINISPSGIWEQQSKNLLGLL